MTIDLSGLPKEVIARVTEIVEEARRVATPVVDPEGSTRPPLRGRFAHTVNGGWTSEQFEAARREMMESWEKKMTEKYGDCTEEPK